jgi:uncharacterized lipoprotein YehR (DUF1307 family)
MKKSLLFVVALMLTLSLLGCESIEYYETNQFNLLVFNDNISIVGYKEGYYSEDLVIDEIVTYYNTRTNKEENGYIGSVEEGAFQNINLKTITINISDNSILNDIYDYAFADNENLISVILYSTIYSIGHFVFANDTSLEVIDLKNVVYLGNSVFSNCLKLSEIYLGSEIKLIGNNAFENCYDNLIIYIDNPIPPKIGEDIFKGVDSFRIMVPQAYLEIYQSSDGWSSYASNIYPQV